MSTGTIELALFPLNVVLFPGTVLPLHIFEPRYRQMISDCQQQEKPFGVVLVAPGSEFMAEVPYPVGTMAEIHNLDHLPDGRYTLVGVGTTRFRIIRLHREKAYLSGIVEPFTDSIEPQSELAMVKTQARKLFDAYLHMLLKAANEPDVQTSLPEPPEELSHFIAYFLDIQNEIRQHLLELTSTCQRLQEEISILQREVPFLRQILLEGPPNDRSRLN
jgi:Lon protease-like protein